MLEAGRTEEVKEEFGDLLFAVVNAARFSGVDAETALRNAISKFARRFKEIETNLTRDGVPLEKYTLEEMDAEWDRVKARERESKSREE